jgi:hypothetical protein
MNQLCEKYMTLESMFMITFENKEFLFFLKIYLES